MSKFAVCLTVPEVHDKNSLSFQSLEFPNRGKPYLVWFFLAGKGDTGHSRYFVKWIVFCPVDAENSDIIWRQAVFQHIFDEVGGNGLKFLAILINKAFRLIAVDVVDIAFLSDGHQSAD